MLTTKTLLGILSFSSQITPHNDFIPSSYLPLHYAIAGGTIEMCELLLKHGSDYSSYVSGIPALVPAASRGDIAIVQLLIDAGVSKGLGIILYSNE